MSDIVITARYRLALNSWKNGTITIRQVELFVKTEWLTRDQADTIYTYPRAQTALVIADPFSYEAVEAIRQEVSNGA